MFKLVSLRASGFKRLDIEDKLEFPDGRVLVHGRNESGKSTLMEAIHYALYGMPLRPSKNAGNEDIICYSREQATVELEFSIEDTVYQVRRDLYKKKTNYHVLNKREQDGGLTRVATGARNVNDEISEILHGIDSEALLNSCLVEQKALGKLESSTKQDRIRAMSSLLNLEAFIDSRDKLKKDASELEKTHKNTLLELQKAEQAKQDYETAQKQLLVAEKRIKEIAVERKTVQQRLEQLQKDLAVIQQMKVHQNKITEHKTKLDGKNDELSILRDQLKEVEKAEKELEKVTAEIPDAEKHLSELEAQQATIKTLSELKEKIDKAEASLENIKVRLNETERAYHEAQEAKQQITELDEQIKEYSPVRGAVETLNRLSSLFNKLDASKNEITRLEPELSTVKDRIQASQSSADKIEALNEAENQAKTLKSQAKEKKKNGAIIASIGVLVALALMYLVNTFSGIAGVLVIAYGGYVFVSNDPDKFDVELERVRDEKTGLISEQALLEEHRKSIQSLETQLTEAEKNQSQIHEEANETLNKLPLQPREYRATVNINEPVTLETLRTQIQEDTETLTRITTEKTSLQKKADTLKQTEAILGSLKKELETKNTEAEAIRKQITEIEQETGLKQDMETEINRKYTEANKRVTQLTTQKTTYQQSLERRPQLLENIMETSNELNLLQASQKQEEKQLKELEKTGVNLSDEPDLNTERDQSRDKIATLNKDEEERTNDITESKTIIENTAELRDHYPVLAEDSERETFRIESMRRAQILLDTTREGIMAGVKQDVEKNMMQFLPTLTDNRYNMAQIDETNYRIEVYDREAKQWRGKGVFSGATQDQFSLALRLAFAISTIPSSRGARPGFIFLDEPLSGFDAQRRTGFIELLRDDLSRHFDQIIVISHIEALAEEFPQNLTLDSGKIVQQ